MRALKTICLSSLAAASLAACASDGGYGYGDRYGYRDGPSSYAECKRQESNNRTAGTVVGAGVGALAGSAIAGNSSNTEGAIAGGVAGAIIGNQVAKSDRC